MLDTPVGKTLILPLPVAINQLGAMLKTRYCRLVKTLSRLHDNIQKREQYDCTE